MSQLLINLNSDLKQLRDEGYEVEVNGNYLILHSIPYVTVEKKVALASLISELTLAGDHTVKPSTHVVNFTGEYPCDKNGNKLHQIVNASNTTLLGCNLTSKHTFSSKPKDGYQNYYEKMTAYVAILLSQAQAIDPNVDPRTFKPIENVINESAFRYVDTATSRAGLDQVSKKLNNLKIAIIGLGGTGSHILDHVAKTSVKEIHLYDNDLFLLHNAYRSPGVPSNEDFNYPLKKVDYYKKKYSAFRRGIVAHDYCIDYSTVNELKEMDFVFISIDSGASKQLIFDKLEVFGVSFIDVGMGLYLVDESSKVGGLIRVTTSTKEKRDHIQTTVSMASNDDDVYNTNIQTSDLNALNAVLAVIKWKQLFGYYLDIEKQHSTTYTIDGNLINNQDSLCT